MALKESCGSETDKILSALPLNDRANVFLFHIFRAMEEPIRHCICI